MPLRWIYVLSLICCLFLSASSARAKELWVYAPANLLVPKEVERLESLMSRARPLGYTHFMLADSKFSRLHEMDRRYFQHVERLQKKADSLGLQLVPAICPVGYSNDLLAQDPNLAEGLPVREALYVVQGDRAVHTPETDVRLPPLSERKKWGFIDESLRWTEESLRSEVPHSINTRVSKKVAVQPFRQYHVSLQIKTQSFDTPIEVKPLTSDGTCLNYTNLQTKPTQDWTTHHVVFNSLDHREIQLYIGAWGPQAGTLWLKELAMEECGAVNLIRRETAPVTVRIENKNGTDSALIEGTDFEPWSDPRLGCIPYGGEYEVWHDAPDILLKKTLPTGTRLRVSYYHTHIVYDGQVCAAISDKKFESLLTAQIKQMSDLFPNRDWMMSHDEYRVMGWTTPNVEALREKGESEKKTPGDQLTHNAKFCYEKILAHSPKARVFAWNDMFDVHHNAVDRYYLVNGSLKNAKLPANVIVMNWNFPKRQASLEHFARLGHHQLIAGYYDGPVEQMEEWLDVVTDNKISHVDGVMYTTWKQNYRDLEAFADRVRNHPWYQQP